MVFEFKSIILLAESIVFQPFDGGVAGRQQRAESCTQSFIFDQCFDRFSQSCGETFDTALLAFLIGKVTGVNRRRFTGVELAAYTV